MATNERNQFLILMHAFVPIPIIPDFEPWTPQGARNRLSHSLSVFLQQTTDDKPLGILRATHPQRVQVSEGVLHKERRVLIKVRPSRVDSELSDMSAHTSPCKLAVTDPNLAVFNISRDSSAGVSLGFSALRKVRAEWRGLEAV